MITLYQFPFSHFCEKARWALDCKGLAWTPANLLPGPHLKTTQRLAPKSALPILVYEGTVVQDSTAIITFLDGRHPDRPLTPGEPARARESLDWEEYFDAEIGVMLRLWFYFHALPDRERALRFLAQGASWRGRVLMALIFPRVRDAMRKAMAIDARSARKAGVRWLSALDRLDHAVRERRFLVGDSFTRADLTACALLSPFVAPGIPDAELEGLFPAEVNRLRLQHRTRPYFQWVLENYRVHRHRIYADAPVRSD